jgi:hypothetical protein
MILYTLFVLVVKECLEGCGLQQKKEMILREFRHLQLQATFEAFVQLGNY